MKIAAQIGSILTLTVGLNMVAKFHDQPPTNFLASVVAGMGVIWVAKAFA